MIGAEEVRWGQARYSARIFWVGALTDSVRNTDSDVTWGQTRNSASDDLTNLVQRGILIKTGGQRGRGTAYRAAIGRIGQE